MENRRANITRRYAERGCVVADAGAGQQLYRIKTSDRRLRHESPGRSNGIGCDLTISGCRQIVRRNDRRRQWIGSDRLDWSTDVDLTNPVGMPDEIMPIFGTPWWDDMDEKRRGELRRHVEAWRTGIAQLIAEGKYTPTTANGWLVIDD